MNQMPWKRGDTWEKAIFTVENEENSILLVHVADNWITDLMAMYRAQKFIWKLFCKKKISWLKWASTCFIHVRQ